MHNRPFPRWLRPIGCCCAALIALAACTYLIVYLNIYLLASAFGDGMVGVEGWVVEAPAGEKSDITMKETKADQPRERVIENAWVELWTGDGKRLLERREPGRTKDGSFSVGYIGRYTRGMRYLIKAGAPGYQPLSKEVKLRKGGEKGSALIQLAPIKQEDRQGQ